MKKKKHLNNFFSFCLNIKKYIVWFLRPPQAMQSQNFVHAQNISKGTILTFA